MATKSKKKKLEFKDFVLKNTLLTLRYWSQSFTTSLFDKNVADYNLTCQYPLSNFNLELLKNPGAVQLYLDIEDKVYISRVKGFIASVSPESVILQMSLTNIRLKSSWDLEFNTPSTFYDQILADKTFFKTAGKKLEEYVKPLGLSRKVSESDPALRRRTISYLQSQLSHDDIFSEEDLKKLREDSDA